MKLSGEACGVTWGMWRDCPSRDGHACHRTGFHMEHVCGRCEAKCINTNPFAAGNLVVPESTLTLENFWERLWHRTKLVGAAVIAFDVVIYLLVVWPSWSVMMGHWQQAYDSKAVYVDTHDLVWTTMAHPADIPHTPLPWLGFGWWIWWLVSLALISGISVGTVLTEVQGHFTEVQGSVLTAPRRLWGRRWFYLAFLPFSLPFVGVMQWNRWRHRKHPLRADVLRATEEHLAVMRLPKRHRSLPEVEAAITRWRKLVAVLAHAPEMVAQDVTRIKVGNSGERMQDLSTSAEGFYAAHRELMDQYHDERLQIQGSE